MANHKHDKLIPSPFPTVTQYEKEFIKEGNRMTAEAVAGVVKYIAQATAAAIKDKQGFLTTLEEDVNRMEENIVETE